MEKLYVSNKGSYVNLRAGASTGAKKLARIPHGAEVEAVGYKPGWHLIYKINGQVKEGYMQSRFLKKDKPDGTPPKLPGIIGNGPNSQITVEDIRKHGKAWTVDTKTTHPQIRTMQEKVYEYLKPFTYFEKPVYPDGIYGKATENLVNEFQANTLKKNDINFKPTGKFGKLTLTEYEEKFGELK